MMGKISIRCLRSFGKYGFLKGKAQLSKTSAIKPIDSKLKKLRNQGDF